MEKKYGLYQKIKRFMVDKNYRTLSLCNAGVFNWMDDEKYLKMRYKAALGKDLNLNNPRTFDEKINWIKLYNRNPEYIKMVDKYEVKQYIADKIGEQYVIPAYGVWDNFNEIDFNMLPDSFVLKCTHDSGGIVICRDKKNFDKQAARKKLNHCLKRNYFWLGREWLYKYVKPRIIAEAYVTDESGYELKDYKVFNFDGEPKAIQLDFDRFFDHKRNLYDTNWKLIDGEIKYKSDPERQFARPECLDEMLNVSRVLSKGIPHVRTDFYCINNKLYFGEMTFYHGSGIEEFRPESLGFEFGSWLRLPSGKDIH